MINQSGIGVYLRGCLPFFLKSADNFLLIGNKNDLKSYESKNAKIIDCNIKPFTITETLFFPAVILKQINKTDIFYSPFFNILYGVKIPVFITIHDIIFPDMPELSSKTGLIARMFFYRRAFKISKKIFTVSCFSKSRIECHLGKSKPVIVTHSAIQKMYLDYRESKKNIQKKDTIIFIGNIKKHKGLNCLLDAFISAKKDGLPHKLIIIGSKENFRTSDKEIVKKILAIGEDSISFTGFIDNETLLEHLSNASLLVQPSLYEGFCLPPLEAMVLGTVALISDIPVLKEIYEEYPVTFFKAGDSSDLKEKMVKLLTNKNMETVSLPQHLVTKYSFEKTASIILKNIL